MRSLVYELPSSALARPAGKFSAETIQAGLDNFRRAGVDLPIIYPFPMEPGERSYRDTIEAMASV